MKRFSTPTNWAEYQWDNPPAPFNPDADPAAAERYRQVSESMQRDGYYAEHTREECRDEWRRRYEELAAQDSPRPFR